MKKTRIKAKVADLVLNEGQLDWLPRNPRQWTQTDIDRTAKSLTNDPDFLEDRPLLALRDEKGFIVFAGNLRLTAARKLKLKEVPGIIYTPESDEDRETIKRRSILDNGSFGAWDYDALANEWDDLALADWGVPAWNTEGEDLPPIDDKVKNTELLSDLTYDPLYYEPKENPALELSECINDEKFRAKVAALDEYDLTDEQKETLKMFAYRFLKIDFEAVANYYYFNATDEEKKAMERLRLVLVDDGSLSGFVEDGMLRVSDLAIDSAKEDTEE